MKMQKIVLLPVLSLLLMPMALLSDSETRAVFAVASQQATVSKIITPGNNGFTLRLPTVFKETRHPLAQSSIPGANQAYYQYEYNGVRIQVGMNQFDSNEVANKSVHLLLSPQSSIAQQQLRAPKPLEIGGRKGYQIQYQTQMMPMAKQMNYRVLGLVDKSIVWSVVVSYKTCDERGQNLARSVLESIHFAV